MHPPTGRILSGTPSAEMCGCTAVQVDRGVNSALLSQGAGASKERMVVVLDARGASSLALTRHMALLKHMAVVLNQHYPVGSWRQCTLG